MDGGGKPRVTSQKGRVMNNASKRTAGKAKKLVGRLVDNDQMELEGKAKELKGEARQAGNRQQLI